MEGFELAATLVATSDFQNFFSGPWRPPEDPPGRENGCVILGKRLGRPQNRITAFLQGIMLPRALVDCKYEAIRAIARGPVKIE